MIKSLLFLLFIFPFSCLANGEGSEQLFGQWTQAAINGNFGKGSQWIWYGDVSIRSTQDHKDKQGNQGYDIGSIPTHLATGYQFDKMNSLMVGYVYQYSQPPYAKKDTNENRSYQQYQNVLDFGDVGKLQNRTRYEQRWVTTSDQMAQRLRHQIKYQYPFNKEWGFVIAEEIFFNINSVKWGPKAGFDQNRIFVGPVYNIDDRQRIEFGYMNNYVNKDLKSDLNNQVMVINYYFNFTDY
jgi:hypothetical protein